jgi:hypothetical protein
VPSLIRIKALQRRSISSSLAKFAAMRRASSRVSSLAAERRSGVRGGYRCRIARIITPPSATPTTARTPGICLSISERQFCIS